MRFEVSDASKVATFVLQSRLVTEAMPDEHGGGKQLNHLHFAYEIRPSCATPRTLKVSIGFCCERFGKLEKPLKRRHASDFRIEGDAGSVSTPTHQNSFWNPQL